jgi:hypothetical protein
MATRAYKEERYKYGVENVERIGDDAYAFHSTLMYGPEDSLFS